MWYDMVFLDLPWGGNDYASQRDIELKLGETKLTDVCATLLPGKCQFIGLKVPSNYACSNLERVLTSAKCGWKKRFEHRFIINRAKQTFWWFIVYEWHARKSRTASATLSKDDEDRISAITQKYWN